MVSETEVIEMVVGQLEKEALRSEEEQDTVWLNEKLKGFKKRFDLTDEAVNTIEIRVRQKVVVLAGVRDTAVLDSDEKRVKWLTEDRIKGNEWFYWNRFKENFKAKDIPDSILVRTDTDTGKVLTRLGDPLSTVSFKVRGMVIGDVQAGKTNNYSALINKAADAGYKLVIVLTGTVEDLRRQTQERLDSDFVGSVSTAGREGRDPETKIIGVGKRDDSRLPFCLTDRNSDITQRPSYSISTIGEPILVVTKKNKHMLKRLETWLSSSVNARQGQVQEPVLIIDDEADNASVNTGSEDEDPKTINLLIRKIISCCNKVSYVAYTATPFANIFIHPDSEGDTHDTDDLFPKHFIMALEPPNNYCGANYFFRTGESTRILQEITDADTHLPISHKPGTSVSSIPKSLIESIGAFLLACSVKDIRRGKSLISSKYDSMLINMSRLTTVQSDITPHVELALNEYWDAIRTKGAQTNAETRSSVIGELKVIWNKHYSDSVGESWGDALSSLLKMTKPVVVTVHSKSGDKLEYEENGAEKIIAVGGLKLSRGLTLEGLVVSYFYRRSVMYDSLMQMGRWYGYRDNYQDLLKLWATSESLDWYAHISEASDEIREQAAEMMRREVTPREFGLRVRSSPDALMVTAANKMRTATSYQSSVRFDNRLLETDCVDSRDDVIQGNLLTFDRFIKSIDAKRLPNDKIPKGQEQHFHYRDVDVDEILSCIKGLDNHPSCGPWAERSLFDEYILSRAPYELEKWDVFIWQPKTSTAGYWESPHGGDKYKRNSRTIVKNKPRNASNSNELRLNEKQHIADGAEVEALGLDEDAIFRLRSECKPGKSVKTSAYRAARKNLRPSLVFHLIRAVDPNPMPNVPAERDVLGWVISIPPSEHNDRGVSYQVTLDWYKKYVADVTDESEA